VLCDFFLFQKLKMVLDEKVFNNTIMICGKPQDSRAFEEFSSQIVGLLLKSHEDYFEEDNID